MNQNQNNQGEKKYVCNACHQPHHEPQQPHQLDQSNHSSSCCYSCQPACDPCHPDRECCDPCEQKWNLGICWSPAGLENLLNPIYKSGSISEYRLMQQFVFIVLFTARLIDSEKMGFEDEDWDLWLQYSDPVLKAWLWLYRACRKQAKNDIEIDKHFKSCLDHWEHIIRRDPCFVSKGMETQKNEWIREIEEMRKLVNNTSRLHGTGKLFNIWAADNPTLWTDNDPSLTHCQFTRDSCPINRLLCLLGVATQKTWHRCRKSWVEEDLCVDLLSREGDILHPFVKLVSQKLMQWVDSHSQQKQRKSA